MGKILLGWIGEGQVVECNQDPWMEHNMRMPAERRQESQMSVVRAREVLARHHQWE
jgi:hypothetical protein